MSNNEFLKPPSAPPVVLSSEQSLEQSLGQSSDQSSYINNNEPNNANDNTQSFTETIKNIIETPIQSITGDYTILPLNGLDTNSYIIALNKSSNVVYLAICTLIIGIIYIFVIYILFFF